MNMSDYNTRQVKSRQVLINEHVCYLHERYSSWQHTPHDAFDDEFA